MGYDTDSMTNPFEADVAWAIGKKTSTPLRVGGFAHEPLGGYECNLRLLERVGKPPLRLCGANAELGGLGAVYVQDHRWDVQFPEALFYLLPVANHQYLQLVGADQFLGDAVHFIQGYSLHAGPDGL